MAGAFTRRYFFFGSLLAGAVPSGGFGSTASLPRLGFKSPNEKLNLASIGAGGRAAIDLTNCESENIVALCDVDAQQAARKFQQHEGVPQYQDFRRMLDREKSIDAVIVTIPDFMHAPAALWCMERGKHVYVQKPLARTAWETRQLRAAAAKYKVATQMGNQGYSNEGTRQAAEMVWAGEIGDVTEVHAWTDRPIWPQGLRQIPSPTAVAEGLNWNLWLGNAAARPYTSGGADYPDQHGYFYQPFNWRAFYDFGCGALGDMACHILGPAQLALRLGAPTSVECLGKDGTSEFSFPRQSTIRFDFPPRGDMPALQLYWYDGVTAPPAIAGVAPGEYLGEPPTANARTPGQAAATPTGFVGQVFHAAAFEPVRHDPKPRIPKPNGSLFIGTKGMLTTGTYGENTRLLPVERMKDYTYPAPLLTRSPGHHRDWLRAAKGGEPACSRFDVAAPFVEWVLLGVIAQRVAGKLEYDAAHMRFTNNAAANQYLRPTYRKNW